MIRKKALGLEAGPSQLPAPGGAVVPPDGQPGRLQTWPSRAPQHPLCPAGAQWDAELVGEQTDAYRPGPTQGGSPASQAPV